MKTSTKSILGGRVEVIGPADCVGAVASHIETTISGPAAVVQPLKPVLDDTPQHTPGPWTVEQDPAFVGDCHPLHKHRFITCGATEMGSDDWGYDPSSYIIAKMTDGQHQAADAHLIAAAPEMIHALELAAMELNKMGCECDCENSPLRCPVCAVNSAIAKAKGQP